MEQIDQFQTFSEHAMLLALSATRIAVAFLLLPLFSGDLIPALVRNSIFVALAMIVVVVQPGIDVSSFSSMHWFNLFAKEAFIGIAIGVFFGIYLWAFETAGVLIDMQVGSSMAMIFDPLSGHEVTLFGEFLSLWINFLFVAAGGLLLLTGALLSSYGSFPVSMPLGELKAASVVLIEQEFSSFFKLAIMIASPILVVLFTVDMAMGLVNRYAQQLNVLFLSISLKSLAAIIVLLVMMPFLTELLINQIADHTAGVESRLNALIRK
ncbi:MAG: type III secretion system export apparatus subunit SctT [Granulosicoccaceae bacterium]